MPDDLEQRRILGRLTQLENELKRLKQVYAIHQHNDVDGTNHLRKTIILDRDQFLIVGLGAQATAPILNVGTASEQEAYSFVISKEIGAIGFGNQSDNMQLNMLHQPNNVNLQSFINAYRKPIVSSLQGTSISTTAAGTTVTINGFNFATNSLAGALIDIFSSAGALIETQTIASNTSTVITITGTWLATTNGGTFQIYVPVFMGSADTIFQRFYCNEDTVGGIRFGVGATAGGQNGLLYMDAAGDLYWRDKANASVKLN